MTVLNSSQLKVGDVVKTDYDSRLLEVISKEEALTLYPSTNKGALIYFKSLRTNEITHSSGEMLIEIIPDYKKTLKLKKEVKEWLK